MSTMSLAQKLAQAKRAEQQNVVTDNPLAIPQVAHTQEAITTEYPYPENWADIIRVIDSLDSRYAVVRALLANILPQDELYKQLRKRSTDNVKAQKLNPLGSAQYGDLWQENGELKPLHILLPDNKIRTFYQLGGTLYAKLLNGSSNVRSVNGKNVATFYRQVRLSALHRVVCEMEADENFPELEYSDYVAIIADYAQRSEQSHKEVTRLRTLMNKIARKMQEKTALLGGKEGLQNARLARLGVFGLIMAQPSKRNKIIIETSNAKLAITETETA